MAKVDYKSGLGALRAWGSFGFGRGYGGSQYGKARYGTNVGVAGIYQAHWNGKEHVQARMRFYRPTNPRTTEQQSWRSTFADAWPVYNSLTSAEKLKLSKEARGRCMTGPNLFMSRWLQSRR